MTTSETFARACENENSNRILLRIKSALHEAANYHWDDSIDLLIDRNNIVAGAVKVIAVLA